MNLSVVIPLVYQQPDQVPSCLGVSSHLLQRIKVPRTSNVAESEIHQSPQVPFRVPSRVWQAKAHRALPHCQADDVLENGSLGYAVNLEKAHRPSSRRRAKFPLPTARRRPRGTFSRVKLRGVASADHAGAGSSTALKQSRLSLTRSAPSLPAHAHTLGRCLTANLTARRQTKMQRRKGMFTRRQVIHRLAARRKFGSSGELRPVAAVSGLSPQLCSCGRHRHFGPFWDSGKAPHSALRLRVAVLYPCPRRYGGQRLATA